MAVVELGNSSLYLSPFVSFFFTRIYLHNWLRHIATYILGSGRYSGCHKKRNTRLYGDWTEQDPRKFNSAGNSVCTNLQHKLAFSKMPLRVPKPERFCRFKNTTVPPKDPVYRTLVSACDRKLNHSYRWRIWKWNNLKWFKRPISTERNERGNFWRRWERLPLCTSLYQALVPKWLDRWHAPLRGTSWNP